ncbi:hypothetical protein FHG87_008804 [Trinorchestia longiramus]|nr:hypothetical protein FHG87_008804 [Trinorchestia longiramus]
MYRSTCSQGQRATTSNGPWVADEESFVSRGIGSASPACTVTAPLFPYAAHVEVRTSHLQHKEDHVSNG